MQKSEVFSETASAIGRQAGGISQVTVLLYIRLGFLEAIRSSNGTHLLKPSAAEIARKKHIERMANKGRPRSKKIKRAIASA